jgi:hypothetical protein
VTDKPAHILEISDSLARDVDKAKAGKLKHDLPVEAFMSQEVIAEVTANSAAAAAPLRAENLKMITAGEAAARNTFNGQTLPRHAVPRRVIPEAFQRPRFDLDRHGRTWDDCRVEDVVEGDVVPDVGRLACDPETVTRYETIAGVQGVATGVKVILTGIAGNRVAFDPGSPVKAFRRAELWAAAGACACSTSGAAPASAPTGTRTIST